MRVPLDYYRILGLPLAASDEQLRQAYGDRIMQLPRREYSPSAISSRKKLIEEAYVVLSDPNERSTYDQLYLAHAYHPDTIAATSDGETRTQSSQREDDIQSLSIEIAPAELVGALLILQELGEYELVLKLGRPYLVNRSTTAGTKRGKLLTEEQLESTPELPDIILTVSLACLELGREQWQQGHYENAALSLETGVELLVREGLFPNIQSEIVVDIYRLRPYRILELLALPQEKVSERQQGLALLESILGDRGGIDGTNDDQSGLNIDDFLRFIQQIRNHLTVTEQHKLFEAESQRPSAVATYLAVYAMIARGFAQRQPALIRQAKQLLMRLGKRQDVHLEQSLCALLLGQTEEATRVLELSQEYEALALIREKSQDSPDLLPGLCLYGEQWLQQEVFPHFRDLARVQASLKEYFADKQVQTYLEDLPTDAEITHDWAVINHQSFPQPQINYPQNRHLQSKSQSINHSHSADFPKTSTREIPLSDQFSSNPANISPETEHNYAPDIPIAQLQIEPHTIRSSPQLPNSDARNHPSSQQQRRKRRKPAPNQSHERIKDSQKSHLRLRRNSHDTLTGKTHLVGRVFISLVGLLVFLVLLSTVFGWLRDILFPGPSLEGEQLAIQLDRPVIEIPDPKTDAPKSDDAGFLTTETAETIIRTWLSTKATALGPTHAISGLDKILTGSALTQWQLIADKEREENSYRKYDHHLKIESVDKIGSDPSRAVIKAIVNEFTQFYQHGQKQKSSTENLLVKYDLIRKNGTWLIQSMSATSV